MEKTATIKSENKKRICTSCKEEIPINNWLTAFYAVVNAEKDFCERCLEEKARTYRH